MHQLDSILDQLEDALLVSDNQGEILYYNQAAVKLGNEILKKPLGLGLNLLELVPSERKEIIRNILVEIQHTRQRHRSLCEYKSISGTLNYLEVKYTPMVNADGEITYVHIHALDCTQQKAFENKLTTLVHNTSQLIEDANAIIIGLDTRGYITDWNEHCSFITGYEKRDVYAQRFADLLLQDDEKAQFEFLLTHVIDHRKTINYEMVINTGKKATLLLNTSVRYSASGQIIGVVLIGQDVTELTEYRKSLEIQVEMRTRELQAIIQKEKEIVEMKSRFVSIASHEFRTPLSSIQHAANFIRDAPAIGPLVLKEKFENIDKQIQHMTHLLDDVLTYSKNEAGKIQLITATVNLHEFITKIVAEVGHSIKNTHCIEIVTSNIPEVITTDEKLLRSILINLLTNAIKFSPGCESVDLRVAPVSGALQFTITDQGMGVPPDELEKIFEPFLRGKAVNGIPGTGLGLSIVKKAVELLRGTLTVNSKLNEGTQFTVVIPQQTHFASAAAPVRGHQRPLHLTLNGVEDNFSYSEHQAVFSQ